MRILIGYSMRSGSTLLQHILDQHPAVRSYSDISSFPALASAWMRLPPRGYRLIKPVDLFYLLPGSRLLASFDRHVWLIRDPRDCYLSAVESGYAYLFWPPGKKQEGIDIGLVKRWKKIVGRYLQNPDKWHLIRYEDLATDPDRTLKSLLDYLHLPQEKLLPFSRFNLLKGGDYKLRTTNTVNPKSVYRFTRQLSAEQLDVFDNHLEAELKAFGYSPKPS
ncbi:MAG: sulfotransferase [Desulfovermiculus sp.]